MPNAETSPHSLFAPLVVNSAGQILGQLQQVIPNRPFLFARLAPFDPPTVTARDGDAPLPVTEHQMTPYWHPVHGQCLLYLDDPALLVGLEGFKPLW